MDPNIKKPVKVTRYHRITFLLTAAAVITSLSLLSRYNYLYFHILIEMFSIFVAYTIFAVTWNTRDQIESGFLIILGIGYLFIGSIDLIHTFAYKGMNILPVHGANLATQLWITARYMESISILAAILLFNKRVKAGQVLTLFILAFLLLLALFLLRLFPVCYIEGSGLTPFKKISEYLISSILLISLILFNKRRFEFDKKVWKWLASAIVLTMASEISFTFYISIYGLSNLTGHFFKLFSFYFIYRAVVETGIRRPQTLLFRSLQQTKDRLETQFRSIPTPSFILEKAEDTFCLLDMNAAAELLIQKIFSDLKGKTSEEIFPRMADLTTILEHCLTKKKGADRQVNYRLHDSTRDSTLKISCAFMPPGMVILHVADITEECSSRQMLLEAARLEAAATLAKGIAHEYNNMMTVILGNIELLKMEPKIAAAEAESLEEIAASAKKAADLAGRMLDFAQIGRHATREIDMNEIITQALQLQLTPLPAQVAVAKNLEPRIWKINGDPAQMSQVVINLCRNAFESLADRGEINITTANLLLDPAAAEIDNYIEAGRYVCMSIRDTGSGMDSETLAHAFEPFFTTRFQGRGLGLAAAYGIVKQHRGHMTIDSTAGTGTTAKVYLPVL